MNRMHCIALVCLGLSTVGTANAQWAQRPVPGTSTGLEMSIDGALEVVPGDQMTYLLTLHEIRGDAFRPVAGAQVNALASFSPQAPVAQVQTDEWGRATVRFETPADLPSGFELIFEARAENMQRRFGILVSRSTDVELQLSSYRAEVQVGGPIGVWGRVRGPGGAPLADVDVTLGVQGGSEPSGENEVVRTDRYGMFVGTVRAPTTPGRGRVNASIMVGQTRRTANIPFRADAPEVGVRVHITPEQAVVRAGGRTNLRVRVRDARGRPLSGVRLGPIDEDDETEGIRTDRQGLATMPWRTADGRSLQVRVPARDMMLVHIPVVVDDGRAHVATRIEGGGLLPEVESYVYVHAVDALGQPVVDEPIRMTSGRFDTAEGRTDAAGVARLSVRARASDAPDACGGATAVSAVVHLGSKTRSLCLRMDPDGTVRVRANRVNAGLQVELERVAAVAQAPIAVSVFRRRSQGVAAVFQQIVPAGTRVITHEGVPEGELFVRARPLIGPARAEVRGGVVRVAPQGTIPELSLPDAGQPLRVDGRIAVRVRNGEALAFVVPTSQAWRLETRARQRRTAFEEASEFAETPLDLAAPAILRAGEILATPMPEQAFDFGVLRDPWRQRSRYRSGRLALILRALEEHVAQSPLADVAHREGRGYAFNSAVLDALDPSELGAEGARDLGGLALTLDALRAMDPSLTFDRMARRITRRRLLQALIALRDFVRGRELDLAFARLGEPEQWWSALGLETQEMLDGWGRPMRFVRTRSGRARFNMLEPVAGFELLSAGSDGRFGTSDDVWDPSARVLPSGSLYAEAMNEDGILAQLSGVALGRATVQELVSAAYISHQGDRSEGGGGWPLPTTAPAIAPLYRDPVFPSPALRVIDGEVHLPEPEGATSGTLVVLAWNEHRHAMVMRVDQSATVVTLDGEFPSRMDRGAEIEVPFALVGSGRADARIEIQARGVSAELVGSSSIALSEGAFEERAVRLRLNDARASLEIRVVDTGGTLLARRRARLRDAGLEVLRVQTAEAAVAEAWPVSFDLPDGVGTAEVRVTAIPPGSVDLDPALSDMRRRTPALLAWAAVLSGRDPDPELLESLRRTPPQDPLSMACAAVVLAAVDEDYAGRHEGPAPTGGPSAEVLAALAHVAPSPRDVGGTHEERQAVAARAALWRRAEQFTPDAGQMARHGAALLLADPRDSAGRALYVRALARTVEDGERRLIEGDPTGTMALSVAAAQLGQDEVARALVRGGARRSYVAARRGGVHAFWLLAASAHGAFGRFEPTADEGTAAQVEGVSLTSLPARGRVLSATFDARDEVRLTVTPAAHDALTLVRVEATYARLEEERDGAPMMLRLEGDAGRADERGGLELHIHATDEAIAEPRLGIQLPAATRLDLALLQAHPGVVRAEVDSRGLVSVVLSALGEGERRAIALPVEWLGAGERTGFAVGAWEADRPWAITSLPARDFDVER